MTDIATFDETIRGLSPPRGERLERVRDLDVRIGGAESNVAVAVAAARLGCETTWLSRLPASPLARRVTGELRSHGVRRRDGVAEANCRRRCRGRDRQRGRVCDRKRRRGLSR